MRSSCQRASLSIPLLSGLVTASRRWTALWTIPLALSGCRLDLFFMSYFFLMSSSAGPTHPCLQVLVFYALYGTISNSTGTTFFFNNFSKHQASRIGCMVATIHSMNWEVNANFDLDCEGQHTCIVLSFIHALWSYPFTYRQHGSHNP